MNYISLGSKIKKQRRAKHMTQEKLAEVSGISISFMGHIERGSRKASIETLVAIANALEVTTDFLLADSLYQNRSNASMPVLNDRQRLVLNEIYKIIDDNIDAWIKK